VAGLNESLKVTRRVWFPASIKASPVAQSTPMEGSPALWALEVVDPTAGVMQLEDGWF